jgi:propanol-preferring alcohol dehydrogenase
LRRVPIPTPEGRDILIKVYAASFCHTDAMIIDGVQLHGGNTLPLTGSHEAVGIIHKLGRSVNPAFSVGDRVGTLNYYHPCGTCADCADDDEGYVYCQRGQQTLGLTRDGGFAEYLITDSMSCFHLPETIKFVDAAPLMCAGVLSPFKLM